MSLAITEGRGDGAEIDTTVPMSKQASLARAGAIAKRIVTERHDRPSLVATIACDIAAEILEDIRKPGDDLNSVELAKRFQTSRTPIREALMLLEREGLAAMPPRRRPHVGTLSTKEIRDIYRIRANLMELIAADIATNTPLEDIQSLKPMLVAMRKALEDNDPAAFYWANVDFHERNTEIADNRTVKRIIDSLLLRTLRFRKLGLSQPGRPDVSLDDHERLYRAYEERDPTLAAALIRSNHISGLATVERVLGQRN